MNNRLHGKHRGFTLIELLVVMFIIMLLAGTVTVMVTKRAEEARHAKAVADIQTLGEAIDQYHLDNSSYPSNLDALYSKPSGTELPKWNGPYIKKAVPNDPWERAYTYKLETDDSANPYELYSLGRDGEEGGKGTDADISIWD